MNEMTQEDLQAYITKALEEFIKECEENESV
jgi:hypothetical protein